MKRGWWAVGLVGLLAACESTSVPKTDLPDSPNPGIDAGADGAPLPPGSIAPKLAPIGNQSVVIGKTTTFRVTVERGSLTGAVEVALTGLPAGVTAQSNAIAADATSTDVTLTAAESAPFATSKVTVQVGKEPSASAPFDLAVRGVPGTIDKSFGTDGFVADRGPISAPTLAVDGTIIESGEFGLVRKRKPDGTIDTTFGTNGEVQLAELAGVASAQNIPAAPIVDASGAIFAAYEHLAGGSSTRRAFVAKITSRGARDAAFGTNGLSYLPDLAEGTSYRTTRLLALADGSVVVVANIAVGAGAGCSLFRLGPTGALDTKWGPNADGAVSFTNGVNGRQGVFATTTASGGFFLSTVVDGLWQGQWNKAGVPDPAFGGGQGFTVTAGPFGDAFTQLNPMLAKRADGALDFGFVDGGVAKTMRFSSAGLADSAFGTRTHAIPATTASSGALVDRQGRTLFGFTDSVERGRVDVWRFTPSGQLDTSLNGTGKLSVTLPSNVVGFGVGIRSIDELPDGRILVAVSGGGNAIIRFWP